MTILLFGVTPVENHCRRGFFTDRRSSLWFIEVFLNRCAAIHWWALWLYLVGPRPHTLLNCLKIILMILMVLIKLHRIPDQPQKPENRLTSSFPLSKRSKRDKDKVLKIYGVRWAVKKYWFHVENPCLEGSLMIFVISGNQRNLLRLYQRQLCRRLQTTQSLYFLTRTSTQNFLRFLANGLGAKVLSHCHDNQGHRAASNKVRPVLAGRRGFDSVRRKLSGSLRRSRKLWRWFHRYASHTGTGETQGLLPHPFSVNLITFKRNRMQ